MKSHETFPFLTLFLVALCVSVFALQNVASAELQAQLKFTPLFALERPWTFITSVFLHASTLHLVSNMFWLIIFGFALESYIGVSRKYILATFLIAGAAGGFSDILTIPVFASSLGASGAIGGLVGLRAISDPSTVSIMMAFLYAMVSIMGLVSPTDNVAHGSHLAGLLVGVALGYYFVKTKKISSSVWVN